MSKLEEVRIEKLEKLREAGVDPWGGRFDDRAPIERLRQRAPAGGAEPTERVRTAGRIMTIRNTGKLWFVNLQDKTGSIQLLIGRKQVGDAVWAIVQLLDLWDLVGVEGLLGRTRTGEISIFVDKIVPLAKTIAQPPEKYHGIHDIELRLRRRYVDMIQDPAVLRRFETRAAIIRSIRRFLDERGFTEVETPTMQASAGGAAARPFITHHNALDVDFYLRIALELYLKRLLVGGMERVYELGRVWRNEGIDSSHNPEFTMLELYEAYGDYGSMMELTESMVLAVVESLGQGMRLAFGATTIDFTPPWRRAGYDELLRQHAGAGLDDPDGLAKVAATIGVDASRKHPDVVAHEVFEACVEDKLAGPVFVTDYPAGLCPLTKRCSDDPRRAERFELYLCGLEVANAYTELNDPLLQESLFSQQLAGLKEDESMAKMDHDFVLALKHGMPPAGGLGIGIDRLVMLLTNTPTIRDVILFPLLRPERRP